MDSSVFYLKGLTIRDTESSGKKLVRYRNKGIEYKGFFHEDDFENRTLKINLITNSEGLVCIKPSGRGHFEGRLEEGILVDDRDVIRS